MQKHLIRIELTEDQKREIASLVEEMLYAKIGHATVRKAVWIIGLGVSALVSAVLALLFHRGG